MNSQTVSQNKTRRGLGGYTSVVECMPSIYNPSTKKKKKKSEHLAQKIGITYQQPEAEHQVRADQEQANPLGTTEFTREKA